MIDRRVHVYISMRILYMLQRYNLASLSFDHKSIIVERKFDREIASLVLRRFLGPPTLSHNDTFFPSYVCIHLGSVTI